MKMIYHACIHYDRRAWAIRNKTRDYHQEILRTTVILLQRRTQTRTPRQRQWSRHITLVERHRVQFQLCIICLQVIIIPSPSLVRYSCEPGSLSPHVVQVICILCGTHKFRHLQLLMFERYPVIRRFLRSSRRQRQLNFTPLSAPSSLSTILRNILPRIL